MKEEIVDGFKFVALNYPFNHKEAIKIEVDTKPIDSYIAYINERKIEQAEIIMPDLNILNFCPTLKYLKIRPSYNSIDNFDFTPLYNATEIKSLNCLNRYGDRKQFISEIDYSYISGLVDLSIAVNKGTFGYNKVKTLKSLDVGGFIGKKRDISDLFCSSQLDTLRLIQCGVCSLDGIEISSKMQCVYLHYNRSLRDISMLKKVKKTLKALRVENCPRIEDFSVLYELENLELLELWGSNTLESLDFLKGMKGLKTFVFNMNVLDGNLSNCLNLPHVVSCVNRKHYNLKDSQLPKGIFVRGNEDIEPWRRLE